MRTRPLILTNESSRHPFRQALPRHVLTVQESSVSASDDSDWKLFLLSFCAFFTAFYSFIF
ncbi:hypothetical protein [Sphingobium agri]|jgi:hypothetical protein|uniref:Uncharacterized protein n=1 Tax=Sphingobium agri TaxID=2933566 RepID=A0ABT0DXH6_9SPHN|nr:hypothetical protein [Sphingobium agri]MCK0531819.1 hypothetical protein [Sphingobium agri]